MSKNDLSTLSSPRFELEPVFTVRVELGPEDDDRVRLALSENIGLNYGNYDHVSFETAVGTQVFRGHQGTANGAMERATTRPVRSLTFSIPRNEETLKSTLDIIHRLHSYEEPVVYVDEAYATRACVSGRDTNPNKWWRSGDSLHE